MAKRLVAKIETYEKDGETKGKYLEIGVILSNDNGEFALLNPTVDLSGVLMKQRILAQETGGKVGDSVMCAIFDNSNQGANQGRQPAPAQDNGFDDIPFIDPYKFIRYAV